jgi:hypothetical protein
MEMPDSAGVRFDPGQNGTIPFFTNLLSISSITRRSLVTHKKRRVVANGLGLASPRP